MVTQETIPSITMTLADMFVVMMRKVIAPGGSPWGNKPSQGGLPSGGDEDAEEDEYTAEELKRFWDHNNDILEFFGLYETGAIGGAAMSAAGAWATQHFGRPLMSPESISLITGVALIEPTLIAEFLVGVTIGLVIVDVGVNIIQNDLQSINNGIVNSGALQQGGSVSANSGSLQISNSNGVTTVDTTTPYIAPITLFLWSVSANGP